MTPAKENSVKDIQPNIKAANCYFIFFISGILILQNEKTNKFVRFHAFQSIYYSIFFLVFVGLINYVPLVGNVLVQILTTIFFLTWVYLIYSAYSYKELKLPVLGDLAYSESRK